MKRPPLEIAGVSLTLRWLFWAYCEIVAIIYLSENWKELPPKIHSRYCDLEERLQERLDHMLKEKEE